MGKGAMGKGAQQHALVDANGATRTKEQVRRPGQRRLFERGSRRADGLHRLRERRQ